MLGSECDLKMRVRNLEYPFRLKILGPKTFTFVRFFDELRDLMANIFRMKRDIDNRAKALESTRPSASSENFVNFGPQTGKSKTGVFTQILVNLPFASLPGVGTRQMEPYPTKLCQTVMWR